MAALVENRVFLGRFQSCDDLSEKMGQALDFVSSRLVRPDSRIYVKPNLTYPFYKPGVTTSPGFMEALVSRLVDTTRDVTFVESDGGAYAWPAHEAMAGHGLPDLCKRYGIKTLNLTNEPRRAVTLEVAGKEVTVELSAEMLDKSDLFITMPVPKVHAMTGLSLAFKNQWGCLPDVKRLRNHPEFDHKIIAINQALRTELGVYDGTYFLNRSGPMEGDPVEKKLIVVARGIGAGDLVCTRLMGVPLENVSHLRLALSIGLIPKGLGEITLNQDIAPFVGDRFVLERTKINYVTLAAFHSKWLTQVVYDSRLAKPIHDLLYLVRGKPQDVSPRW